MGTLEKTGHEYRLSVIVPLYNMLSDGKLEFCLDSLVGQSMHSLEIIAVNDASTDGSLDMLREYEAAHPGRVKVIDSKVNRGPGGARNLGIRLATGEYLGFVDADDFVDRTMFEKLYRRARETDADVVCCDYYVTDRRACHEGSRTSPVDPSEVGEATEERRASWVIRPGSIWSKLYRSSMIVENGLWFPENTFYGDNPTASVWMLMANRLEKVNEPLYYYYQHAESITHVRNDLSYLERLETARTLLEWTRELGVYESYKEAIDFRFVELYYVNTLLGYLSRFDSIDLEVLDDLRRSTQYLCPRYQRNSHYGLLPLPVRARVAANNLSPRLTLWIPETFWNAGFWRAVDWPPQAWARTAVHSVRRRFRTADDSIRRALRPAASRLLGEERLGRLLASMRRTQG